MRLFKTLAATLLLATAVFGQGKPAIPNARTVVLDLVTSGASAAYLPNDAVGAKFSFTYTGSNSVVGYTVAASVIDSTSTTPGSYVLVLLNADFTAAADNAPFLLSWADRKNIIGVLPISTAYTPAGVTYDAGQGVVMKGGGTDGRTIYGQLYTTGALTLGTQLRVKLQIWEETR